MAKPPSLFVSRLKNSFKISPKNNHSLSGQKIIMVPLLSYQKAIHCRLIKNFKARLVCVCNGLSTYELNILVSRVSSSGAKWELQWQLRV